MSERASGGAVQCLAFDAVRRSPPIAYADRDKNDAGERR
jgi:hypothetical protein